MNAFSNRATFAELEAQTERILHSRVFAKAHRSKRLLRYLVDAAVEFPPRSAKEFVLAIEVFDRDSSYDPTVDATVRVEASRLRNRLREYYAEEGQNDSLLIQLPKGAYSVIFTLRESVAPAAVLKSARSGDDAVLSSAPTQLRTDSPQTSSSVPHAEPLEREACRTPWWTRPFLFQLGVGVTLPLLLGTSLIQQFRHISRSSAEKESSVKRVLKANGLASPAVREACARGRNYFDKREAPESEQAFRQAIDLDPDYAPAYSGLANALTSEVLLEEAPAEVNIPRAIAAIQRALYLDPQSGDALIARGSIELTFLWQWDAAETDLQRGTLLSPNNSFGQMQLAVYYDAQGDVDEAVVRMRHAIELDPLSFFMARHYGSTLYYARRYSEALAHLQYARAMHPQSEQVVDGWIRDIYWLQGQRERAIYYDLLPFQKRQQYATAKQLLSIYRRHGASAYWSARANLLQDKTSDACFPYERGLLLLLANRSDEGLRNFDEAANRHCYWISMLPVDPQLDSYRRTPAYATIVHKLQLPPAEATGARNLSSPYHP